MHRSGTSQFEEVTTRMPGRLFWTLDPNHLLARQPYCFVFATPFRRDASHRGSARQSASGAP